MDRGRVATRRWTVTRTWAWRSVGRQTESRGSAALRILELRCKSAGDLQQTLDRVPPIAQYYGLIQLHVALLKCHQAIVFDQVGTVC